VRVIAIERNRRKVIKYLIKDFAAQELIYALLNSIEYSKKVKKIINKKIALKNEEEINELDKDIYKNSVLNMNRNSDDKISNKNINIPNDVLTIKKDLICDDKNLDKKINIPIEVINKFQYKNEINNMRSIHNINETTIMNFEIFCMKWERYTLIDKEYFFVKNLWKQ